MLQVLCDGGNIQFFAKCQERWHAYQEPKQRCLQEVHLRRYEPRPLTPLILRHREPGSHPKDCDANRDKYSQSPDPQSPTEATVLQKGLEKERKHKAWSMISLKMEKCSQQSELTAQPRAREDDACRQSPAANEPL